MRTKKWLHPAVVLAVLWIAMLCTVSAGVACAGEVGASDAPAVTEAKAADRWDLSIALAVAIGLPCLGAAYAVGKVGAAALGAASERPELLTRSLLFVALAEGIAIYGLLIAILIWAKM